MRSIKLLTFAALGCVVGAGWFRWTDGGDGHLLSIPQETGNVTGRVQVGWTPKPTPAAGAVKPASQAVLELLQRGATTANTWVNSETCGWYSDDSSSAFTCGNNGTCATNDNHIVGCVSGTLSPFYSLCLNLDAYYGGSCVNVDMSTGCCMDTKYPECATYLWTDPPRRSMYRCWSSSVIVNMLDEPQFVHETMSASSTITSTHPLGKPGEMTQDPNTESKPNLNIGAIVGGTIGGVIGLICLFFLCSCFRRYRARVKKDRRNVEEHLSSLFQYSGHSNGPESPYIHPAFDFAGGARGQAPLESPTQDQSRGDSTCDSVPPRRAKVRARQPNGFPARDGPPSYELGSMNPGPRFAPRPQPSRSVSSFDIPPPRYEPAPEPRTRTCSVGAGPSSAWSDITETDTNQDESRDDSEQAILGPGHWYRPSGRIQPARSDRK
ncbi:hypothetical protein F4804DRAFT_354098 [Jackrogersella minutella]|nr:hypothetical protein F4804DRAFT_354098 [Jackrogersella minutella]